MKRIILLIFAALLFLGPPFEAAALGTSGSAVYSDGFVAPWGNASYTGSFDFNNSEKVYAGSAAIKASTSAFGSVSPQRWNQPQAVSDYANLQFAIYPVGGNMETTIALQGPAGYFSAGSQTAPGDKWTVITKPITSFNLPAGFLLDRIYLTNESSAARVFYIDEIKLTVAGDPGVPTPGDPGSPNPGDPGSDDVAPTILISSPSSGSTLADKAVIIAQATDNVGVAGVQFKIDGTNIGQEDTDFPYLLEWNTAAWPNGRHSISATARDAAGNRMSSSLVPVTVSNEKSNIANLIYYDGLIAPWGNASFSGVFNLSSAEKPFEGTASIKADTVPFGSISSQAWNNPQSLSNTSGIEYTIYPVGGPLNVTTALQGPAGFFSAGSQVVPGDQWSLVSKPLSSFHLPDGFMLDRVYIQNQSNQSRTFYVDNIRLTSGELTTDPVTPGGDDVSPRVTITAPAAGARLTGPVALTAEASDNNAVTGVQFKLDGSNIGSEDLTAPYEISWNSAEASNGRHTLSAAARDAAGNSGTAADVAVTTDNETPVVPPPTPSSGQWVTSYYGVWSQQPLGMSWLGHNLGEPPDQIDWTGVTHVVHFNGTNVSETAPYFEPAIPGTTQAHDYQYGICTGDSCVDYQKQLISAVHAKGGKVVISIGAVSPTGFNVAVATEASTQAFVDAIIGYVKQKGYDGVELDVETWTGTPVNWDNVNRFIAVMRRALDTMSPKGLFLASPGEFDGPHYSVASDSMIDQYNIQTYSMGIVWNGAIGANGVWFMNALYSDIATPTPGSYREGTGDQRFEGRSIDASKAIAGREYGVDGWIKAGHDPKKIGVGLGAYSNVFRSNGDPTLRSNELYQKYYSGSGFNGDYADALRLLTVGGVMHWDDQRKVNYIDGVATANIGNIWWGESGVLKGDKFFATFETPQSIAYKAEWIKQKGIGGVMLYAINSDFDPTKPFGQRNPILNALTKSMAGPAPATIQPAPSPAPSSTPQESSGSPVATTSPVMSATSTTPTPVPPSSGVKKPALAATPSPKPVPPVSAKFKIGDKVRITGTVNVRRDPTTASKTYGLKRAGAVGTIIGGPVKAQGYIWWQINYGFNPYGWSIESRIKKN